MKMADVKLLIPTEESGNLKKDVDELRSRFILVLKELEYLLCNLDEENVMRAGSVYAENIDTTHAKISDAQIGDLSADKLVAGSIDAQKVEIKNLSADSIVSGTLDAEKVTVKNLSADALMSGTLDTGSVTIASESGKLVIFDSVIVMYDTNGMMRFFAGLDTRKTVNGEVNPTYNKFRFDILNESGVSCVHFDDNGDAVFKGIIDTRDDVNVGNMLRLNDAYADGGVYFCNNNSNAMASIVCDGFEDGAGVLVTSDSGLYVNGEKVATQSYVTDLVTSLIFGGGTGEENSEQ